MIKQQTESAVPIKEFDILLAQLLGSCPVDLIPGKSDPTNLSMPQQVL
jgi:DNA polymerase II small subunit/DNA polymerase delta subunit B